ncbi:MAG: hypothetical protein ABSF22_04460 [Bryobacteraceae bacterium]|jgi:hypothetical protein
MIVLSDEIEFQISLLNIASLGAAERQAQELEKMLAEQKSPAL